MSEIERYIVPGEVNEAVEALASGAVTVFAGGTDLTPQINEGRRHYAPTLMNISHIDELSGISLEKGHIRIGSLVTVSDIRSHDLIADLAPILCEAADHFASEQIRNAATIGGNICNASPAGDMIIPLLVLGATVELARWQDGAVTVRQVGLHEFFTGPGRTIRRDDELLTAAVFPRPSPDFIGQFRKSGLRPALEISTVSMGLGGDLKEGRLENVRVAFGAVGPTPLRGKKTEAALEGKILDQNVIGDAVLAAREDVRPMDDIRATKWYRNHLIGIFTEELLNNVCHN